MVSPTLLKELLAEHKAVAATLKASKDREMKLRVAIVNELFPSARKGTNKASLKSDGLEVKAVIKETWSVKETGLTDLLAEDENLQRAFKYKHEVVVAGYNSLTDDQKKTLANNVTCKNGAPELSYEGELGLGMLSRISTENGLLKIDGEIQGVIVADQTAKYFGFQYAEQLVKFLEELQ